MATAFAGIVRAPLTSVIMIFEITRDYSIVVPVMIANLLAYFISKRLQAEPIYEALLHQEGIHLPPGRAESAATPVLVVMHPADQVLSADDPVPADIGVLRRRASGLSPGAGDEGAAHAWPVLDGGRFVGMFTLPEIEGAIVAGHAGKPIREILPPNSLRGPIRAETFPHVHADQPVEAAMRRMAKSGLDILPVVDRSNPRDLLGTVCMADIMNAFAAESIGSTPVPTRRETIRPAALLATLVVVLIGSFILVGLLTRYYHVQRQATAKQFMENGKELARQNRAAEAIEQYRNAVSLTHSNDDRLTLASALMDADQLDEARIYLEEFHAEAPRDGRADVALARLAARQGRVPDAVAHYREATSAEWPDKTGDHRSDARFELADVLYKSGASKQALAELLNLADRTKDTETRLRIAQRMLAFGAPLQAEDLFEQVIHDAPGDAGAHAGLGDARLAESKYSAAQDALRTAHRLNPQDEQVEQKLVLTDRILALDPTLRGLSSAERYARSLRLLEGSLGGLEQCLAVDGSPSAATKDALDKAHDVLSSRRRPPVLGDGTESNITLAEQLWVAHQQSCKTGPVDAALRRVLERLSQ
jgi:tetratricopeptide (TPR) repeat protein